MNPFVKETGVLMPLMRDNIDTDAILPKQYLKLISRTGFGVYLFDDWRYLSNREPNPDFVLNEPRFANASFLLSGANFGCGSSREHAVWALADYGFRAVIAPSFADIFYNNCFKNGVLPVSLSKEAIARLAQLCAENDTLSIEVDLEVKAVRVGDAVWPFELDEFRRQALLQGLDEIGQTLTHADEIAAFETRHRQAFPWIFDERGSL
ncbi:3-isopropylmalate dehydratase small subunit [Suttonella sp. R2A3]|uniref:3-isopropylmalate dehydratase small subunit n=1 Tax=Suttonella sp. R2A3 TaxID=2908648 RepID=UPI001F213F88|nr:3-isopropylmalate dehydratase small subunit [Suttonella sp. R2A3]UJF24788.1 3-isopropylmalate dehydratase small subunit [Suttonella sp. R2A3]